MAIQQKIQDFYKVAQARDFARKYQFRILDIANKGVSIMDQDDLVYATSATIPGKTLQPVDVPYNGLNFRVPGTVSYNQSEGYPIQFYSDSNTTPRIKIENWIEETFSDATTSGDGTIHADSSITLAQLNTNFEVTRTYKLFGVFPVLAGDLEYDITSTGEVVSFQASFAYQFFRRDNEINDTINKISKLV